MPTSPTTAITHQFVKPESFENIIQSVQKDLKNKEAQPDQRKIRLREHQLQRSDERSIATASIFERRSRGRSNSRSPRKGTTRGSSVTNDKEGKMPRCQSSKPRKERSMDHLNDQRTSPTSCMDLGLGHRDGQEELRDSMKQSHWFDSVEDSFRLSRRSLRNACSSSRPTCSTRDDDDVSISVRSTMTSTKGDNSSGKSKARSNSTRRNADDLKIYLIYSITGTILSRKGLASSRRRSISIQMTKSMGSSAKMLGSNPQRRHSTTLSERQWPCKKRNKSDRSSSDHQIMYSFPVASSNCPLKTKPPSKKRDNGDVRLPSHSMKSSSMHASHSRRLSGSANRANNRLCSSLHERVHPIRSGQTNMARRQSLCNTKRRQGVRKSRYEVGPDRGAMTAIDRRSSAYPTSCDLSQQNDEYLARESRAGVRRSASIGAIVSRPTRKDSQTASGRTTIKEGGQVKQTFHPRRSRSALQNRRSTRTDAKEQRRKKEEDLEEAFSLFVSQRQRRLVSL